MDKTLIKTVTVCVVIMLATVWFYPKYKDQSRSPLAEWHVINVNNGGVEGDANLLLVGNQTVMIDAGNTLPGYNKVVPYLRKYETDHIDHFFVTHPSEAYYGGLVSLIDSGITVRNLYIHRASIDAISSQHDRIRLIQTLEYAVNNGTKIIEVNSAFVLSLPNGGRIQVVREWQPQKEKVVQSIGETSMVLRFDIAGSSVLFAADIDAASVAEIAKSGLADTDFIKLSHPDPEGAAAMALLDAVSPGFVLVPSSKRHWCTETGEQERTWTLERQVPTWVTGLNGSIRVIWRSGEFMVVPQHEDARCKLKEFGTVVISRSD